MSTTDNIKKIISELRKICLKYLNSSFEKNSFDKTKIDKKEFLIFLLAHLLNSLKKKTLLNIIEKIFLSSFDPFFDEIFFFPFFLFHERRNAKL